jgi:predicted nucleotidyltransferase component of viral defense system
MDGGGEERNRGDGAIVKEEAFAIVAEQSDPAQKLNLLREYLQALTLRSLHESEAFVNLCFVGGTALRFIHALPRFSEDLDFSLHREEGYRPDVWMKKLKTDLTLAGFNTTVSWNDRTTVHKSWVRIAEVMQEAGLADMREHNLSIKLEIDTRPPAGASAERTIITRHRILALQHYDLSSLMAGKLHALITRGYPKGRDWYDVVWYRGHRPPLVPNLTLLQNALDQTQGKGAVTAGQWKEILAARLAPSTVRKLAEDVAPFLERPDDASLLTMENLRSVLR